MVSITPSHLCFTVDFAKGLSKRLCNTGPLCPSLAGTFERVLNKVFKCFCCVCSFHLASERVKTGHLPYSVLILSVGPWCNLEYTVDCLPGDSEVPALSQDNSCQNGYVQLSRVSPFTVSGPGLLAQIQLRFHSGATAQILFQQILALVFFSSVVCEHGQLFGQCSCQRPGFFFSSAVYSWLSIEVDLSNVLGRTWTQLWPLCW